VTTITAVKNFSVQAPGGKFWRQISRPSPKIFSEQQQNKKFQKAKLTLSGLFALKEFHKIKGPAL
jgi:hypothetical protein